jgi:tetratricopeptide (TPR) repeat protein
MKITKILKYVILIYVTTSFAQNNTIDSLIRILPNLKDTNKVIVLSDLCWMYRSLDREIAKKYGNQALELAKKINYKKGYAQALNDLGILFYDEKEYAKALNLYNEALKIREELRDTNGIAALYNKIGIVHQQKGDYQAALRAQLKALKIYELLKNDYGISMRQII